MNKISTVLFDYGGVVSRVGNSPISETIYNVEAIETNPELHNKYRVILGLLSRGQATENAISDLFVTYGYEAPENIERSWRKIVDELFFPESAILQLIADLKTNGYKVALLSNVWPLSELIFREKGYYDSFDELILSCRVGYAKPDKEIYEIALKKLAVSAEEVLFIDDQARNLEVAKGFGMQTILSVTPEQVITDVRQKLTL